MSKGNKISLSALLIFVAVVALLAIVIPRVVNIDRYRPQVVAQIHRETGKPVEIGRLRLAILPQVAIRVDDFSLSNPPGFPAGEFVRVKEIVAVVDALALLHHQVVITSLKLHDPALNMLEDTHGKWNFENPATRPEPPLNSPANNSVAFSLGVISRLSITRGQFFAASLLESGAPGPSLLEVHGAAIDLHDVNLNALTTSALHAPSSSPGAFASLLGPFKATVYAADANPPAMAEGTIKADALLFGPISVTRMRSTLRLFPKQVFFDNLELKCFGGRAEGNLSLNLGGANLAYAVDAKVKDVRMAEFLDSFPQARGLMTGTLEGAAQMKGLVLKSVDPLSDVTGTGHGSIRDGRMPSLQITGNVRSLARFAGMGPADGDPSSFSLLSADFRIADTKLSSNSINLDGNGVIVAGSGSLTTAGEGSLDYQGEASLAVDRNNPLASILGGLAGAKFADGKMTFPFVVGGNFSRPKFSLKGGAEKETGATPGTSGRSGNLARGLSGFLKKKKQQ